MEGTAVKNGTKEKTLQQKGTKSEENRFRPFMEIFRQCRFNKKRAFVTGEMD
jgi:hypothetical protein